MKRRTPQLLTAMLAIFLISCSKMTPVVDQVQTGGTTRGTMPPNRQVHTLYNPKAAFSYTAIRGNFHAPAGFNFMSSNSPADSIWWDFGDGIGMINQVNPSHIYPLPGTYSVILRVKAGMKIASDTQRITILNALYTHYVIDSIRAEVIRSNRPDTVYFAISDSANSWESERFALPAMTGNGSSPGTTTQSFSFQHPDIISQFGNNISISVRDDYRRPPYGSYVPPGTRGRGTNQAIPWTSIIYDEVSPYSLIGYPTVLENQELTIGGGLEFTVYLTWK